MADRSNPTKWDTVYHVEDETEHTAQGRITTSNWAD